MTMVLDGTAGIDLPVPLPVAEGGTGQSTQTAVTAAFSSLVFLSKQTASNSPSIDFTGLSGGTYKKFLVIVDGIVPVTNAVFLYAQVSTGSGFISTGYKHETFRFTNVGTGVGGSTGATAFDLTGASESLGTGVNQIASFEFEIYGTNTTSPLKNALWRYSGKMSSASFIAGFGGGEVDTNSANVDGLRFLVSSGNISTGTFSLYGLKDQ